MEIHQMRCHKKQWIFAETGSNLSLSKLKHIQTPSKSESPLIPIYFGGYSERLLTDGSTKNQFPLEDSTFELHENAYQNINTGLGIENRFTYNSSASNGDPDTLQKKALISAEGKRLLDCFLELPKKTCSV